MERRYDHTSTQIDNTNSIAVDAAQPLMLHDASDRSDGKQNRRQYKTESHEVHRNQSSGDVVRALKPTALAARDGVHDHERIGEIRRALKLAAL